MILFATISCLLVLVFHMNTTEVIKKQFVFVRQKRTIREVDTEEFKLSLNIAQESGRQNSLCSRQPSNICFFDTGSQGLQLFPTIDISEWTAAFQIRHVLIRKSEK